MHHTENRLRRSEMWCVVDNYNYMCYIRAQEFLDSIYALWEKKHKRQGIKKNI